MSAAGKNRTGKRAAGMAVATALAWAIASSGAMAQVITSLPAAGRTVALTFDACEANSPAHLDHGIADYLVQNHVPFTVFMAGKFVRSNPDASRWLASFSFVDIENHSYSHNDHMDRMTPAQVRAEVISAQDEIETVTGRRTTFFRFPAGNYSAAGLAAVEGLGYRVVHWRWPVGDPDPHVTAPKIENAVADMTRPGDILIMHINGRGVHTAEALPSVVAELKAKGYHFVTIAQALAPSAPVTIAQGGESGRKA